jgi:hypothetical protein
MKVPRQAGRRRIRASRSAALSMRAMRATAIILNLIGPHIYLLTPFLMKIISFGSALCIRLQRDAEYRQTWTTAEPGAMDEART